MAWDRQGRGRSLRALGPGVVGATTWVLGLMLAAHAALIGIGLVTLKPGNDLTLLVTFDGQLLAFLVFICGLSAFFRSRAEGATAPRVLLLVAIVGAMIGPWIVMAIAGVVTRTGDATMALAAPSPTFAFVLAEAINRSSANVKDLMVPAILCAAGYALFGVALLAMAASRTHKRLAQERERLTQLESMLDAELQAEETAAEAPAAPAPEPAEPAP